MTLLLTTGKCTIWDLERLKGLHVSFQSFPLTLSSSFYLKPHLFGVTIHLFVFHAFVEGDLVAHSTPDFVDSIVVAIPQEVVVGHKPKTLTIEVVI